MLMYHGVGPVPEDPFGLFVSPARFAQQMATLRMVGLRGVSLDELHDAEREGVAGGLVGLTFDDGYRDIVSYAAPVLAEHGFRATLFVVSGLLEGENVWDPPPRHPLVAADEVLALAAAGWEIGSHSVTHARSTELGEAELRREVGESRTALADLTGSEPRSYCYPYGAVDAAGVRAVREAGYQQACAVARVAGLPDTFARPRVGVTERDQGIRFAAKLVRRGL